jgi:diguanylate cyclase (GGDEF)-like protein
VRWARRWWWQSDQFDWLSAYLNDRGQQMLWRMSTFAFTIVTAALPIILLASPAGPDTTLTKAIAVFAACAGAAGGVMWLLQWPTRQQSMWYSAVAITATAAACLSLSNAYTGLMGCTMFAAIGGFLAYFHSVGHMVVTFAVASGCALILSWRMVSASGDIALTCAALLTVLALNVGVPFGIHSLVHTLRDDLRGTDRDPLTGLHNRRSFHNSVYELMMLNHRAPNTHLVIAMIDLDNFKQLNDTHGHAAGDQALVDVATALRDNCRSTAVIGRAGGEEFLIADTDTKSNPATMAERLRHAIAAIPPQITASIGTVSTPLKPAPVTANLQLLDDLIRTADAAMYEAKRAGGNQVRHYHALVPPSSN